YVARSYPLMNLAEVPGQLVLGRPVLVGMKVQNSWFKRPITKSGFVDYHAEDQYAGSVIGALLGWDPQKQNFKVLSPWSSWGERGMAAVRRAAADAYLDLSGMCSIEAVKMPEKPFPWNPE